MSAEDQIGRFLAAEDWLPDPDELDRWWNAKDSRFREEYLKSARAVIAMARDEVLREAAEKIRKAYSGDEPDHSWVKNPFNAADLIDPDKES